MTTANSLPTGSNFNRAQVDNNFTWFGDTPEAWSRTRFLVPNGWRRPAGKQPPPPNTATLTDLVLFSGPEAGTHLRLQAIRLNREITAELWLRNYLLQTDYETEALRPVSPQFADSLSSSPPGPAGGSEAVSRRVAARIHGDLLFLVSVSCAAASYARYAEVFGVCIASFRPDSKPEKPTIEERIIGELGGIIKFQYPKSWRTREVPALRGKMARDLLAINEGQPTGLMRVKICSKDLPSRMELQVEDTLEEFASAGVTPGKLKVNTGINPAAPRFLSGFLQVFEAKTAAGAPEELWVVVFEDADYFFTVSLLTPDRSKEFLIWAWNRTALDIVTGSLA